MPRDSVASTERLVENERFTVTLIVQTLRALMHIMSVTGMSKTDIINRAVQIYDFVLTHQGDDKELLLRSKDGTIEKVHII
ncbi:hypothetical protein [Streptomyces capitiformicae]|uniref:Uncharacterized protein n=1 Tax=Streptomyces capitiformicae TaxID=2014920 RepID=A0A918ZP07_9ACTN|nr:hypothetical protein [Streptomyces capitiformicae]GHE61394.1 hypothetical protein GCM10017771_84590 [Streptomyces capitiformicae]